MPGMSPVTSLHLDVVFVWKRKSLSVRTESCTWKSLSDPPQFWVLFWGVAVSCSILLITGASHNLEWCNPPRQCLLCEIQTKFTFDLAWGTGVHCVDRIYRDIPSARIDRLTAASTRLPHGKNLRLTAACIRLSHGVLNACLIPIWKQLPPHGCLTVYRTTASQPPANGRLVG